MAELKEGEQAPDFTAAGSDGKTHALKDLAGQTVVLYFYPRDNTPGCTIEACEFRDHLARFKKAGAVVLGVSESPQRVLRWRRGLAGRKLDTEVCARQTVPQPNRVQSGVTMTIRYRKTLARRAAHFRQSRVMRWTAILPVMLAAWFATTIHAKPLGQATVTQINNDVRYKPGAGSERPAKRQDVVKGADTLRTGQKSQAELEFEDRTITRLGSNSTFTFDPQKREFELKKGLLLFDMPEGAGGGKIVTPAGTAAIEGTAGIISYRSAPKVICLAGKINVFSPSGKLTATILPGQLFIMGVTKYPVDFLLAGIQTGKLWGNGLPNNQAQFNKFRQDQLKKLKDGELEATPFTMIGEGLDVFVATSGQQFNPVIQDEASLGDQNNNIPEPTNPTTEPFIIASNDKIDIKTSEPASAQITSATSGTKAGTVGTDGKASFNFGSQDLQVQGTPTVAMDPSSGTHKIDLNAPNIAVLNTTWQVGESSSANGPSAFGLHASQKLFIDPSELSVGCGTIGTWDNVAGRLELFGNTRVSVLHSTVSTPGDWTGLDSGIYIAGNIVDLYGSTLDPGPTGVALIRTLTGSLLRPPASGDYYVYRLSDPWPFRLTHTDIFDINLGDVPSARIVNQITSETRLTGSFEPDGTVKFDFGNQNVLVTTDGPGPITTPPSNLFAMNFQTTGNLAMVNAGNGDGGPGIDHPTTRLVFSAANIDFINSKMNLGTDGSSAGPSTLSFDASGSLMVDPSEFYVASGLDEIGNIGGLLSLTSQGLLTFAGNSSTKTKAFVRGPDQGGTINLLSMGNQVQISQALLDASSTDTGNASANGGVVTITGATQVAIQDSTEVLARGFQGGTILVSATSLNATDLLAKSSKFDASSNSSNPNAANADGGSVGLISMGKLAFSGNAPDNYAEAYARGFQGGNVGLTAWGERFLSGGSELVPLDGVFIYDASIDASTRSTDPYLANKGGSVMIDGLLQVVIQDTTTIAANGPTVPYPGYLQPAGTVSISSMGSSDLPGRIVMTASGLGYVSVAALDYVLSGSGPPGDGQLILTGADRAHPEYTVSLSSSSETGGGAIVLNANTSIGVNHASLIADASGDSPLEPGIVHVEAPDVLLDGAKLSANTAADAGPAGRINVFGIYPDGSLDETSVDIRNSHLTTLGNSKNADSGIFIKGHHVDIADFNPGTFNPGPARIVIESFNAGSSVGGQINIKDGQNLLFSHPIDAITGSLNLTCDPAATSPQITFVPQDPADPNWTSYARFSATASPPAFLPGGMNLELLGTRDGSDNRTISVVAKGNTGGGQITADVPDTIKMVSAKLDVSNQNGYAAGNMNLTGKAVILDDTDFDASSISEVSGPGGQITVTGRDSVQLAASTTTMTADGSTAGGVHLLSGSDTQTGSVDIQAQNAVGYIKLKAEDAAQILASLPNSGGFVDIVGAQRGEGPKTVEIRAGSTAGGAGGTVMIKAIEAIRLANVGISADAAPGSLLAAGKIQIHAPTINIMNSVISANAGTASGIAGIIDINTRPSGGSYAGTSVSILNTTLSTQGTAGPNSGIFIRGGTVDLNGSILQLAPSLSAQIWTLSGTLVNPPASGPYQVHTLP